MSKQHLDLLPLSSGGRIRVGQRQIASHIPRAFVDGAWDLPGRLAGTAARLERAAIAVVLAGAVSNETILIDTRAWRREVAVRPLQLLATGADVSVVLVVVSEVGPCEGAVRSGGFIEHRDMRFDAALVHQRCKVFG